MIKVVLLSVDRFEKSTAEEIKFSGLINSFADLKQQLQRIEGDFDMEDVTVYSLEDFAVACNEQYVDLESVWLTYVEY